MRMLSRRPQIFAAGGIPPFSRPSKRLGVQQGTACSPSRTIGPPATLQARSSVRRITTSSARCCALRYRKYSEVTVADDDRSRPQGFDHLLRQLLFLTAAAPYIGPHCGGSARIVSVHAPPPSAAHSPCARPCWFSAGGNMLHGGLQLPVPAKNRQNIRATAGFGVENSAQSNEQFLPALA